MQLHTFQCRFGCIALTSLVLLAVAGCLSQEAIVMSESELAYGADTNRTGKSAKTSEQANIAIGGRSSSPASSDASSQQNSATTDRRIIYQAELEIVVEDFGPIETMIADLVKRHQGFIASANLDRLQGKRRRGTWVVRIPVDQYDSFLSAAGNIGVPASQHQTAQDVTEEYVDVEARIANQKKLEQRIIELLERPDDKLQHVIEVERELARVRENIERMEGRLRYLADQTSLTTVTLSIREEQAYVPPQARSFSSRVSRAWSLSLVRVQRFFENAALLVVGNAIAFLIFVAAVIIAMPILCWVVRRFRRLFAVSADERR